MNEAMLPSIVVMKGKSPIVTRGLPIYNDVIIAQNLSAYCSYDTMKMVINLIADYTGNKTSALLLDRLTGHHTDRVYAYARKKRW